MSDKMLGPGTYLTDAEAKEFHKGFVASMGFFTLVAILAHFLAHGHFLFSSSDSTIRR